MNPDHVFDCVRVDYAGSILVKHGPLCKPMVTQAYVHVAVILCFLVKAVHLDAEAVSELRTGTFIAMSGRFITK